ncbi:hypothetical protein F4801DRAFT_598376 [Xylaria longipes]|nr:hypothetical protein F4801DRAFT_598376 [Xylaria longipes]RYC53781.1 hypothetical protein CHU98_g12427 [Xylaria longipes]
MAAPPGVTIDNLEGAWRMSKTLSSSMESALELQSVPWLLRKAVSFATITSQLSQKKYDNGVTVIQVAQTATSGIKGETEVYRLDGCETTLGSSMFGVQKIRTRWLDLNSAENENKLGRPTNIAGSPIDNRGWRCRWANH